MNAITAALSLGALLTVGQVPNTVITYQYSPLQPTSIAAPAGSTVLVVVQPPGGLATGYQYFTTSVTTVGISAGGAAGTTAGNRATTGPFTRKW